MANTYKINFELTNQFAEVGSIVNFNILDNSDARVTGLESDLTAVGADGTTFTIAALTGGNYDYKLTVDTLASTVPSSLSEAVTVKYQSEDINTQVNTLSLSYIPSEAISGYIGDAITLSWSQGTVEASNVASTDIATANGAVVTLIAVGNTTCKLTYTLGELTKEVSGVTITVATPSVTDPVVSDITDNSAVLTATCTPANVTSAKFRYGLAEEFNPEDDTTYTETSANVTEGTATLTVSELEGNTNYKCQSVIVYGGNTYVSSAVSFITEPGHVDPSALVIESDKDNVNLVTTSSHEQEVTLSTTKAEDSDLKWTYEAPEGVTVTFDDDTAEEVTATITYSGEVEGFTSNTKNIKVKFIATETTDEVVTAIGNKSINIKLYYIINTIKLYIDGTVKESKELKINNARGFGYESITPDDSGVYEYDEDTNLVTAVEVGTGNLAVVVTVDGDETSTDVTFNVAITVEEAFVLPDNKDDLAKLCRVYNTKEQMFGNYRGTYRMIENTLNVPIYAFKLNPVGVKWEYELAMLTTDYVKSIMVDALYTGE
jgi:hypothetical protein